MIHPINMPADFMRAPPARRRLIRERSGDHVFSENDVRRKATITYTEDGRRLRDGEPTSPRSPNALWNEFFLRSFVRKLYLDEDGKDSAEQGDGEGLNAPEETTPQCAIHFPVPQMRSEEKRARPLELKWADLKIRENANQHNTADFDLVERRNNAQLVIRRGQAFAMDLEFYWDIDVDSDSLTLVFELGSLPSESKGTRLVIPLKKHANVVDCTVDRLAIDGARVSVSVSLSARTIVGAWQVKIVSAVNKEDSTFKESESPIGTVYVLFNPWCTNDQVYMPNAADRDEYVLNDVGQIWRGTHGAPKATAWSYGQFESGVLEACLQVLDRSSLSPPHRSSPIYICREVAQMVNGGNEQGILEGKWAAEEFTDGIAPSQWTGSAEILRAFDKFGLPVQYAQCWVFAGVVTTILRALGIPSRVVTNFCSAHDTDTSSTVDIHFLASTGKPIKELNKDSLWMFHVWNDCWMARPDLPEGYGGWQAVDATPQEKSDALYRAGPASLRAIREGQCSLPYDTSFVFAEVQAEKCYWLVDAKKHVRLNEVRKNEIGRMIITKRPRAEVESGADEIMDITSSYKQTEMPQEKRDEIASTLLAGHSSVLRAHQAVQSAKSDVRFDLRLPHCTPMGQDLTATLSMLNESGSVRSVKVCLRLSAAAYTGEQGRKITSETCTVDIKPGERYSVVLLCSVRDYQEKLKGELATFVVSTVARVAETGQVFTAMDDLHLKLPDVEIEMLEQPLLNEPFKAVLKVANPLPIILTNCSFIVEGPGLLPANKIACSDIPSRGIARVPITVTPWKDGERTIIAHFRSKQLQDVNGSVTLFVPSHL